MWPGRGRTRQALMRQSRLQVRDFTQEYTGPGERRGLMVEAKLRKKPRLLKGLKLLKRTKLRKRTQLLEKTEKFCVKSLESLAEH